MKKTRWLFTGKVVAILSLLLFATVTGANEGMAIWADGSENPPEYALWDGTRFSESHEMRDIDGFWKLIRGAYSPTRDEAIVVGVTDLYFVTGQIYSGGQWTDLPFSPLDNPTNSRRWGFDVRYESQSGNPLIVWHEESNARIRYAKWTGSRWSLGIIRTPVVVGQGNHELNLEASPKSNDMVLIVGAKGDTDYAMVWDGVSWGDAVILDNGDKDTLTNDNVVYEQQSGNAIIIYAEGAIPSLNYRIWNGVTWSSKGSVSPPAGIQSRIRRIAVNADPSTNRIVAAVTTMPENALWVTVWDGNNNWGSKTLFASASPAKYSHGIAVAFEGTSQHALAAYTQEGNEVMYRTWSSSSSWSNEERGPNIGGRPMSMILSTDQSSNDVMLAVQEETSRDAFFCRWSGAGWGGITRTTKENGARSFAAQPLFFMWNPTAATTTPTLFPTRYPTPPPTHIPTRAPSAKPTPQPTDSPTPQPTVPPTSPPTSVLTQPPTPVPSPKPTKVPTSVPTTAPSSNPTPQPTNIPSLQPTKTPTPQPSTSSSKPPHQPTNSPSSQPTKAQTAPVIQPPTPLPSMSRTKTPAPVQTQNETIYGPKKETTLAGRQCNNDKECRSNACRNGVCMATPACYPLKHKFGEPFFEHKVNIVFVASGFNTASKQEWHTHVNRTYKSFENYNMFSDKVEQLNMFRVDPRKLDSAYCGLDCSGIARLLCCDKIRALNLAQKCFPVGSNLQTVVIHNDDRYGGGGYGKDNIATASTHPMASVVAAHELGHSLFDLTDEYSYGPGTDVEPNCDSTRSCDKWSDLIGNTPAGYDRVRCLPGCRNDNFYVGAKSFMSNLTYPMGAVNERFTCCTYCALTKSFPSYCNVFDPSPNYLLNYCRNNDYQRYGRASYDKETLQSISDGSVQDSTSKYVEVAHPVSVLITAKKKNSGAIVYKTKQSRLDSGMFLRSLVEGDFSSPRMAWKQGFDSVWKVMTFYRKGKETFFFSRNTTIGVPISLDPAHDDEEPFTVSEQVGSLHIVLDTKGRTVKKIRVKSIGLLKA